MNVRLPFHEPKPRGWVPDTPPCLDDVSSITLDGEFDGLDWHAGAKPCGWAVGWRDKSGKPYSRYLPHRHRAGGNLGESQVMDWLQTLRGKRISNHSIKIDIHMARVDGADLEAQGCTFHDVAHSAALLNDHQMRFNLHELSEDELGVGKLDPGVPKDQIALAPGWQIASYARRDCELVAALEDVYAPRLTREGLDAVAALEDDVIPAVVTMEMNGVPYDQETLDAWLARMVEIERAYLWEIRRAFGFDVDPGKDAHMERVFKHLGIPAGIKIRKSKDPEKNGQEYDSYASEFIEAAAATHPRMGTILKVVRLRSIRSKVLTPLKNDGINGLYTPTYHQLRSVTNEGDTRGVVSGRFSAPLIHQVTGKNKYTSKYGTFGDKGETFWARELFRETDGHWFTADAKQIQYRIMVACSGSERLLQMYRDDPLVNYHKKVEGWIRPLRPQATETEVKIGNFLVIFGGGVAATATFLKCSLAEAQEFRDVYFSAIPEAQSTLDKVKAVAEERGWVRSVLGRRSRFPKGTWTDKYGKTRKGRLRTHKALNAVCQMNEADVMKTKMVVLHRQRKALGLTPRITLHDEYGGRLADKSVAPQIINILNEQSIPMAVPLLWSGGVPSGRQSWADAK